MKVCFVATYYSDGYIRQSMLLKALKHTGHEIVECIENGKSFLRYPKVLWKFARKQNECDIVVVGYRGQEIMPFISFMTRKKIVFDAFLSFYNRACFDREIFKPSSILGRMFFWLDKNACNKAAKVLLDTNEHIKYFSKTFGISEKKFERIFIGAEDDIFFPITEAKKSKKFVVLWYGNFVPLQGADIIVKSADYLKNFPKIEFWLAGDGPEFDKTVETAKSLGVKNIKFFGKISHKEIPKLVANSDVCLGGHFRANESAKTVIAGKAFEMLAMKKPVILGESNAVKELFEDKMDVLTCKMEDPNSLAQAILALRKDKKLRQKIENNGYQVFLENATPKALGKKLKKILEDLDGKTAV